MFSCGYCETFKQHLRLLLLSLRPFYTGNAQHSETFPQRNSSNHEICKILKASLIKLPSVLFLMKSIFFHVTSTCLNSIRVFLSIKIVLESVLSFVQKQFFLKKKKTFYHHFSQKYQHRDPAQKIVFKILVL